MLIRFSLIDNTHPANRATCLDLEIARLQALRAQVVEHAQWLRAQRPQRAGAPSKNSKQPPWPGAKEKRR